MSTKYKNISDQELVLIGVGVVKAGQEFISGQEIINPNIEVVDKPVEKVETVPVENKEEASK